MRSDGHVGGRLVTGGDVRSGRGGTRQRLKATSGDVASVVLESMESRASRLPESDVVSVAVYVTSWSNAEGLAVDDTTIVTGGPPGIVEAEVDHPNATNDTATAVVKPTQLRNCLRRRVTWHTSIPMTQGIENIKSVFEKCLGIWTLSQGEASTTNAGILSAWSGPGPGRQDHPLTGAPGDQNAAVSRRRGNGGARLR